MIGVLFRGGVAAAATAAAAAVSTAAASTPVVPVSTPHPGSAGEDREWGYTAGDGEEMQLLTLKNICLFVCFIRSPRQGNIAHLYTNGRYNERLRRFGKERGELP